MGDPLHRRGQSPSLTTSSPAADESRPQPSSSRPMDAHNILGEASPHSLHRSVSLGEGIAVPQRIARVRHRHARAESVNGQEESHEFDVTRSDDGSDEWNDDEETLFDEPGPRHSVSDEMFGEIQARPGVIARGRRLPGPVPGQTQQGRGQDTRPGQNTRLQPFAPHDIFETIVSPNHSPRVRLTQHAFGHPSGHGHGQQRRGQYTGPLPLDTYDTLGTGTWVPQSPRPRFSQAQHASGHLPRHGQAPIPGHGPQPFRFPVHEHHPGHLPVQGPGHILADRVDPVPVGTYVVRLARSMGRPAVGIWRARADGTWSHVVNLQGGSGEVVLPP